MFLRLTDLVGQCLLPSMRPSVCKGMIIVLNVLPLDDSARGAVELFGRSAPLAVFLLPVFQLGMEVVRLDFTEAESSNRH